MNFIANKIVDLKLMQCVLYIIAIRLPVRSYNNCYICLMASFPGQPGQAGTRKVNHSGF